MGILVPMTKVTIISENPGSPESAFRASGRNHQAVGHTPGAALDGLTRQLSDADTGTLIVVQNMRPDQFFTAAQQARLTELMAKWRNARDSGGTLDPVEQAELEALVDAELEGSGFRAEAMANELLS